VREDLLSWLTRRSAMTPYVGGAMRPGLPMCITIDEIFEVWVDVLLLRAMNVGLTNFENKGTFIFPNVVRFVAWSVTPCRGFAF
jgi:hypothetical protein